MTTILHLIQALSLGGAGRALIATSKCSARLGRHRHRVISLLPPAPEAVQLAERSGLTVLAAPDHATLKAEMAAADIVQLHWWNNPQNQELLRADWPDVRLLIWYHIAGDSAPQLITPELVDFADLNVPTNPWSYRELPVFRALPDAERARRVATVLDAADLDRVSGSQPRAHEHFNVGYIGTVDFVKMHRNFVPMSAAIQIPDVRFVVCGKGIEQQLMQEASRLGASGRFDFRGYVADIKPVIETFDVYGYPLCDDSYASGELNLQEVMAAGVPPVVFPAGGIKGLVEHERTGLIVNTGKEYREAIEHLYRHPEDRHRLGQAARKHALAQFGAENAARQLNPLYEQLLRLPKRQRTWGVSCHRPLLDQPVSILDVIDTPQCATGARLFVESLGAAGQDFITSLTSLDIDSLLSAEHRITHCSTLLRSFGAGGFRHFLRSHPDDGYLQLWHSLALDQEGLHAEAIAEFGKAIDHGCDHWRVGWYIAQAAQRAGDKALAREAVRSVLTVASTFEPAREFEKTLQLSGDTPHPQPIMNPKPPVVADASSLPHVTNADSLATAEAQAREALQLNPNGLEALRLLVSVGLQRGDWKETGRLCFRILQQAPTDIEALLSLAKCFFKSGDQKSTRLALERALEIDPHCSLARENLVALQGQAPSSQERDLSPQQREQQLAGCIRSAQQFIKDGEVDAARCQLEQAVELMPDDTNLLVALGNVLTQSGDIEGARRNYVLALAVDPKHAIAREKLVELALESKPGTESSGALAMASPQSTTPANDVKALRSLSRQNLRDGNFKDAAENYFKLLQRDEEDVDAMLGLGECFSRAGDRESAAMMFKRILQLQPQHELARGNLREVQAPSPATAMPVNHSFLTSERRFWNVATMEDAMFQRVFTSKTILAMSEEERREAWKKSAIDSMNAILKDLPARPDWNVLEIGCGVGRVIKPLREHCASVDGVDISAKMIDFATQYLADAGGRGRVLQNNGCDLSGLSDNHYDLVYSIIVFQHIRSVSVVRSYLSEIRRVLKPNGYFRLQVHAHSPGLGRFDEEAKPGTDYGFSGNAYTEAELRELLEEAGYDIEDIHTRNTWIWATARAGKPQSQTALVTASRKLGLAGYFQPPAGTTERCIQVRPVEASGATLSAYQALKHYDIRDIGSGLDGAAAIIAHILKTKLNTSWSMKKDFWPQTLVLPIRCDLRTVDGRTFDESKPGSLEELGLELAPDEAPRRADIENYVQQMRAGADLGRPVYVTGALLKKLAPSANVEAKAIYMMDGARRITASALLHRRSIDVLLLMHEDEHATLLPKEALDGLRCRLAALKWFESYQSIPLLGLQGQRTLNRFDLMSLPQLRDAVVMDFGCNTGQACLKAAQSGARQVIGIEGMGDTFAAAEDIARSAGFSNVRYANVNFNDADFDRQIDAAWAEPVDYAFFFSVYRTKELTQRERLFRYIIGKARKGIFFEGHASAKIDTLEFYEWLFESFGLTGKFLGYSEGELRPLFFIDLVAIRAGKNALNDRHAESPGVRPSSGAARCDVPVGVADSVAYVQSSVSAPEDGRTPFQRNGIAASAPTPSPAAPLVTAIVSTYANERFMEGRLRDLLAQTLGDRLEIIVVDSASPQNEGAIVKRFSEQHPNIRYIRTAERETVYQSWNRGIRAARGKYVTNANTDDRLRPDALECLAGELDTHPEVALVYGDFFITNSENDEFLSHTRTGYSIKPDFARSIMLDGCHMGPQPMWRRSLHDEIGWFDESLFAAGDYDFWCRIALKYSMLHVSEFIGLYLHNAAGICNSNSRRAEDETTKVRSRYHDQFPAPPKNLPRGFYYREPVKPGRFVNIGMVTFNRLAFTKRSIAALLERTDFPHVLTVVDNASTDGTREYLTALKHFGIIKNLILLDQNVGVAKASNLAWAQEPAAEFYMKLDNDIVIQKPGWLTRMVDVIEAIPELGMIGYSFEPISFDVSTMNERSVRVKPKGTLGGACVLIPKRTSQVLGCWCEDYGLYGEEDLDYGTRVLCQGWLNAYMEDENIGLHLPNGRAATISTETMEATDGLEEVIDRDYRRFKDDLRREQVLGGKRDCYVEEYRSGKRPLFVSSEFVARKSSSAASSSLPSISRIESSVAAPSATTNPTQPLRPLRMSVFSLDHPVTACAVLRLIAPMSRISRPGKLTWAAQITKQGPVVDLSAIASADLLIVQRLFPGPDTVEAVKQILESGKPIVVELDDWFLEMPADNPHTSYAKPRLGRLKQLLQRATAVTVSTEELRQRVLPFNPRVFVLPNLINEKHWKEPTRTPRERIIIGYAGTSTHTQDLAMVEEVLERIAAKHVGRVGFVFMGCATERLSRLPHSRIVEFEHGYERYVRALQGVPMDIALAPLTDSAFNRCKSNIKWVEYSAAGVAGVYADIPAYQSCVKPGETGLLAKANAEDWFRAIDALITDEAKRGRIARQAREEVVRDYTLAAKARLWEELYVEVAGLNRPLEAGKSIDSSAVSAIRSATVASIVIPTFNNLALTRQCLAALQLTTPADLAEVIIVDNGSTDGTVDFLQAEQATGRLRAVFNSRNEGFARGCNQGAMVACGEFLLFLNNDTETKAGWLEAMINTARQTQAGVVGCKLLYPDGTVQHAGIEFINGVPDHPFRHAQADAPEVSKWRDLDMVTGACFLMPKKLFMQLGGFDEVFRNGVEDVDLCLRARIAGRMVVYEPNAVVTHHEGKTQGRFNHVTENLNIFFARWKGQFNERHQLRVPKKSRVQKSEKGLLVTPVNVCWDGSFLDLGSLSHVNRELTRAMGGEALVRLTCLGKNAVPKSLGKMQDIRKAAARLRSQPPQPPQVTVRHAWPPNWDRPAVGAWVLIQPWEFGSLPVDWVQNLSRVDEVWAPSQYVRRVYIESGVEARKVHVVPNGIDPHIFKPEEKPMTLPTKKAFKFLFVGGTIQRKGPDVLLKAYLDSFTANDDVCLVVKDFGGQSVYAGQTIEQQIRAAQSQPNAPEILYLNDELPPEALPGLYTACDCLIHPYRGEGFGLPVLEAMACGLPVVVTAGGSTDDFATDEFAYRLPSVRREFGDTVSGMKLVKPGWMLEPDRGALAERMKWMLSHREEARAKGKSASEHVRREWTWERAAQIAAGRLAQVAPQIRKPIPSTAVRKTKPLEVPACGKLGHLGEARELIRTGKLLPAWNATVVALQMRPYHPEAFLLLAEIAQAAGDEKLSKELAERARKMAPQWKPARQFSKSGKPRSSAARVELPELPKALGAASGEPRLSVFLITKNEERFIGQCLESVRDIASQIVVMDTGSTDWTKSIAERFGAEVYSFEWCDDFSAARNAAMEKVTGDWVLMLDADEELLPDQKDALRKLMKDSSAIAWRLPMIDKGREEEGVSHVPRLFRNAPGLFYVGRIHEQIFSSVEVRRQEWGLENKFGDAKLLHHGYTKELVQSRDKIARNLRLLELAVEELPGEPNLLMNYGLELVRDGRLDEGLEQYAAAFSTMAALPKEQVTPELRESLLTQYATHLISAKRASEVTRILGSSVAKSAGLTASLHWLLGLACIEQNQFADGAEQMRACLAKRGATALTPVNRNILKGGPSHCLALCLAALKQRDAADESFQNALKEDSNARTVRFDYARFLAEGGHEVEALKWVHQLVAEDSSDVRAWQFGGQVALSKPEFLEFGRDWTDEAIKLFPEHTAILEQRATVLLLSGMTDDALPLWRKLASSANPSHQASQIICEALAGRFESFVPGNLDKQVNQEFITWYRRLIGANASRVIMGLNERLDMLRRILPGAVRVLEAAMAEANAVPTK